MKNDLRLKIEYLPPESLTPYEGNARVHEEYDINAIKQSITDTGFNDPIGIWGENNLIVEGHGRRIAAMELGLNSVPCIRLDHMTEEQRKEYALVHNKTAELSRWDFGKLEEELSTLEIDLSGFGFDTNLVSPDSLDDLFAPADEKPVEEPKQIKCPHCGEWFTP